MIVLADIAISQVGDKLLCLNYNYQLSYSKITIRFTFFTVVLSNAMFFSRGIIVDGMLRLY